MDMMPLIKWSDLSEDGRQQVLQRPMISRSEETFNTVKAIIEKVSTMGDVALRELTLLFDRVELSDFKLSKAEIDRAIDKTPSTVKLAINQAIDNVRKFHEEKTKRLDISIEVIPGVSCEEITRPIETVGLYVPSGNNPLPSTAIMLGVPSLLAGCPNRILCSPPDKEGDVDNNIVAAAAACGIVDIYKLGGAQAITAMAYGTESIPRVDKIFGPGNTWVTVAKSLVAAANIGVSVDMPAGPTEVMVISNGGINSTSIAYDLLSQAEHGPDSQVTLLCTDDDFAQQVQGDIFQILTDLPTKETASRALENSKIILIETIDQALSIANLYAPEHLILAFSDARGCVDQIQNAGSVFLGKWSPESAGDYCSGTNHVLPTYGYAKSVSAISVDSFVKTISIQEISKEGLIGLSTTITELARVEGLEAHARAVEVRLED
jgi:histidinol dehydrogenase